MGPADCSTTDHGPTARGTTGHGGTGHGGTGHGGTGHGGTGHGGTDARETGLRVEELFAELRARSGPEAAGIAEELVTCLVRLYGDGLAAIVRAIGDDGRLRALLIADPLVESLLLVHDLHPLDASARVKRALGRLGTGAEFLGIDDAGVAQVRLGHGCGSTAEVVEQALGDAAPEVIRVEFAPREVPLLQIGHRPAGAL